MNDDQVYSPGPDLIENSLDSKTFVRKVPSDASDGCGQPEGAFEHCVTFADGVICDNAGVRFSGRPQRMFYWVDGDKIIGNADSLIEEPIMRESKHLYSIVDDKTICNSAGAVLHLKDD